jgi:hypothetical protein
MDDSTVKLGLLMESAQAHQKLAESHLEKLRAHAHDLDGVVRNEIRRTLTDELSQLTAETTRATQALCVMKRAANMRSLLWSAIAAILSTAVPLGLAHWVLPSAADVDVLRARRDQLRLSIANLERGGGLADWRRCGTDARLCVRVDKTAPTYGDRADYYVIKGY